MAIQRGKIATVSKDVIYGPPGVGKSSLGSTYPNAVYCDIEGSTEKLDVDREFVSNWNEFIVFTNLLILNGPDVVDFETVIFDTADWLEKIAIKQILEEDEKDSMSDAAYSYNRGSVRIGEFFDSQIMPIFDNIAKTGRNVVILAHSEIAGFEHPTVGRYDRYRIKMDKRSSASIVEWAHNVFFINHKTYLKEGKGFNKDKAIGGSEVVIHTKPIAQYEAVKRRDELDDVITFEMGENPYREIIGTEVIKKEQLAKIKACKTEGELIKLWNTSFVFQVKTWFIEEFKAHTEKVRADNK